LLFCLLEIPRSIYYFYKNKPLVAKEVKNNKLKKKISTLFLIVSSTMVHKNPSSDHKKGISVSLKHIYKINEAINFKINYRQKNIDLSDLFKQFY